MILDWLLSLLGIILTIFIVVGIHEGAHFIVAKYLGIKILRFSIGFGKALYTWHDQKGTEYVIAPIPLGGYVKLLDETEAPVKEEDKPFAFNRQPIYKRFAVVIAGPLSNLLLAVILYWTIFIIGFQTPIPIIGNVEPASIASLAGLKSQQQIISVDQHDTRSWTAVIMRLITHIGDNDTATIGIKKFNITPHKTAVQTITSQTELHHLNLENWQISALKPDPLSSLGITTYMPNIPLIIGKIKPDSPAAASLRIGDRIIAMNNTAITSWEQLITLINNKPDQTIHLTIHRHHQLFTITLTIGHQWQLFSRQHHGFLGIGPADLQFPDNLLQTIKYGPIEAIRFAFKETFNLSHLNLLLFWKLIEHKLSILSLGGPITIFQSASSAFQNGLISFLSFLAFLNIALGIINFFPIPGLDGGHILFQFIEALLKRPVSTRIQILCYRLGFIFLFFILIQALTNDLLRLWG